MHACRVGKQPNPSRVGDHDTAKALWLTPGHACPTRVCVRHADTYVQLCMASIKQNLQCMHADMCMRMWRSVHADAL